MTRCDKIHLDMKIQLLLHKFTHLFAAKKQKRASLFSGDYKQAVLIKEGRKQFKALLSKGLTVPVVLL